MHGDNVVVHMLTGRSFRDYLLVDKCLDHMIVSDVVHESSLWNISELVRGNVHVIGSSDKKVLETSNMHLLISKNWSDFISIMGKYIIENCPGCTSIMLMYNVCRAWPIKDCLVEVKRQLHKISTLLLLFRPFGRLDIFILRNECFVKGSWIIKI